ncbi:tetratricopeptide repeat protein [Desulfocicer niacini]
MINIAWGLKKQKKMEPLKRKTLFLKFVFAFGALALFILLSGKQAACLSETTSPCPEMQAPLPAVVHETVLRAEELDKAGKHKQAATLLSNFQKKHPEHIFAYIDYDIGFFFYNAGDSKSAVSHLKKTVKLAPCFTGGWQLLAAAAQGMKDYKLAARAMEQTAVMLHDPDLKYQAALLWMEAKSPKKALPLLRDLEKTKPVKSEWLIALSNVLGTLEKKIEMARTMEKAARSGNSPNLWFHAAWLWVDADRPRNALGLLEVLAQRKQVKADWLLMLCNVYMTLNKPHKAAQTMERAVTLDSSPQNLYTAGVLWLQVNKPVNSRKHLLKLIKLTPPKADWFVALAQSWIMSKQIAKAAQPMEKAYKISRKPDHAYQAGILRLQLSQPDNALNSLLFLEKQSRPKPKWMKAISDAWLMKEKFSQAARAMEKAAEISKKNKHCYRAARLWLQAQAPEKALPLLTRLAKTKNPKAKWCIALSNTHLLLKQNLQAARAMEQGARISNKGEHFYRAAMLWDRENNQKKTISLLRLSIASKPAKSVWFIELATRLLTAKETTEALSVMKQVHFTDEAPALKYRGVLIWQRLHRPEKARPILKQLCLMPKPEYPWLVSMVRLDMELNLCDEGSAMLAKLLNCYPDKPESWKLAVWMAQEKSDYVEAAAAMDVAIRLNSQKNTHDLTILGHYYHMAGIPEKAARSFRQAAGPNPCPKDLDQIKDVLLGGKRYDLALKTAKSALEAEKTPARWETVGDITFLMRRYDESSRAYLKALELTDNPTLKIKSGYALMKQEKFKLACRYFQDVIEQKDIEESILTKASQAMAYIKNIQAMMPSSAAL